jgi:hypothetical protein
MTDYVQLKHSEIKELRERLHKEQGEICPILGIKVGYDEIALDHLHKLLAEVAGPDGKGLIRGSISKIANTFEGKVSNAYRRYGLSKFIDLPTLLRNLADFLENPPCEQIYIHPSEAKKREKLMKRDFNRVKKYYFQMYPRKRKLPKWPKSGILSEEMRKMILEANDIHLAKINKKLDKKDK